jgi:hypothetical protein
VVRISGGRNRQDVSREDDEVGPLAGGEGSADIFVERRVSSVARVVAQGGFDGDASGGIPATGRSSTGRQARDGLG